MKFMTVVTGLVLVLPFVLGTAIPQSSATSELGARDLVYTQEIEPRQAAEIIKGIAGLIKGILEGVERDNKARGREEFTKRTVAEASRQWPGYNWVICHTSHSTAFDGERGKQWGHYHEEYDIKIGGTIGYEIYWFESGRFDLQGDGGYRNWAWVGNLIRSERNGGTLFFA